jgi:hypothetical protein
MSIADRLPAMTLPELTRLLANAERLAGGPAGKPRDDAAVLLPVLEAEISARRDGKKRVSADAGPKPERAKAERVRLPRAPREPKPKSAPKSASEKADDFLADVTAAINRR